MSESRSGAARLTGAPRRRIQRIRWTATVIFALTTLLCLAVLVAVALRIDTASREARVDTDVRARASTLSDLVRFSSDHRLALGNVTDSDAAKGVAAFGFVTEQGIVYAEPDQDALPDDATLRRALEAVRNSPDADAFTAAAVSGRDLHWGVAAIDDLGDLHDSGFTSGIAIVGETVPGEAEHDRLAVVLTLVAVGLVVLAAALGHLVSGWAMRPALRGLADQERFLTEASHELRTPLAVLRVVLDAGRQRGDPDAQRTALERGTAQVDRLTGITDSLLLRARASVGSRTVPLEPVRLDQVVESTIAELPEGERIRVDAEPTVVDGDLDLLGQVVRNLVENARRHGEDPVVVTVRDRVLAVADGGASIPRRARRRMLRSGSGGGGGTGSGLAIVAWIARVHRARLTLDDGPDGGLEVRMAFASPSAHGPRSTVESSHRKEPR